jgi:ATP-dependent helicase/nuclease subunit A
MNTPAKFKEIPQEHPGFRQALASNPLKNHWVGASAGTGKTKVLIDRVLRLMLPRPGLPRASATPPARILCLTFTKTAAAEMSNRIYARLGAWSVMNDEKLDAELEKLIGEKPSQEIHEEARRLFARVLDAPGGLKIMTIHSFCQSVLKRFPIEAGLPPHFELMDEQDAAECLARCMHEIIDEARRSPGGVLAKAFDMLALHLDSAGMSDLMAKIMKDRSLLAEILETRGDADGEADKTIDAVYEYLHAERDETEDSILASSGDIDPLHEAQLRKALVALLAGSKKDNEKAAAMQPWLESQSRRVGLLQQYRRGFLTAKGEPYNPAATKATVQAFPDILRVMAEEAERLLELDARIQALRLAKINAAMLSVAARMVGRYMRHKALTARLDFDDLIIKTSALLADAGMVQWVLYKLDEGIDHILVDEAQDTSPHQWRVVQALSSEFFTGSGARADLVRTLFVVGDEKQSIFSFQGADPGAFARMQGFFGGKVKNVQEGWEIFLEYSFRSTRTVLELVDGVFAHDATRRGVVSDISRAVRHLPFREGHAGLVELWPLVSAAVLEEGAPWRTPVEIESGDDAAAILSRKIAATIKGWLASGEMLISKNRPVRAGDILILVQSRASFVEMLMRALKEAKVPVAGIDRMTLTEEIAVMDLIAAAQFALQPGDDLVLATLLKSPLIGLTEEGLYNVCQGRRTSLWEAVRVGMPDLAALLSDWIIKAGKATPYEFFAEILGTPCFADSVSGRRAFYGRLGFDIHDALDEFLNSCLHYEQTHTPSVQRFINWFLEGEAQIKREQEQHKEDQVRIMTVHGAKGLQAPIVFLPDTVKKSHDHNKGRVRLVWPEDATGVPLWSPRADFDAPVYADLRDAAREAQEEEYRRLLYVALTRAEDRLYVCGYRGKKEPKENCWYNLVSAAFPTDGQKLEFFIDDALQEASLRRVFHPQEVPVEEREEVENKTVVVRQPLPVWALHPPAPEDFPSIPLAPSRPGADEPAARGPLDGNEGWRFRRGIVVHQILEILPQMPQEKWEQALAVYLARPALAIPPKQQEAFRHEILDVLRHPEFAAIFGPGSRAEVPVVGFVGKTHILSGQMDRVLVTEKEVLVIDYKTNRPPPKSLEDAPVLYLKQMAAYRAVLYAIYPQHKVKCALLWTDGPFLMPLPDESLDPYAP